MTLISGVLKNVPKNIVKKLFGKTKFQTMTETGNARSTAESHSGLGPYFAKIAHFG